MKNTVLPFLILLLFTGLWTSCEDPEPVFPPACDFVENTTIAELKALHTLGTSQVIEEEIIIKGTVVADDQEGNLFRTIVVEDETAGISILFGATELFNDYPIGMEVWIRATGLTLCDFSGIIQLGEIPEALLRDFLWKGERGQFKEPTVKQIGELSADDVSSLIKLENVQFAGGSAGVQYADPVNLESINLNIESCENDNTIILRTSGFSDFAGEITPTGSGSITAIFSVFGDTEQLLIRDPSDVEFNDARCEEAAVTGININFDDQLNDDDDIFLDGWTNVALQCTRLWRAQEFDNNLYGQGTAFGDNDNPVMETWLVTPRIDLTEASNLRFESQVGFAVSGHDGLKVYASTDFVGDVTSATWTEINANIANSNTADNTWIDSGDVDLTTYGESVYIGFQYLGSGPNGETSSYRVDNIIVE